MVKFHPKTQTQDWSETASHHTQLNTHVTATFNAAAKKHLGSWQTLPLATSWVIVLHFLQCSFLLLHLSGNQPISTEVLHGNSWCKCDLKKCSSFLSTTVHDKGQTQKRKMMHVWFYESRLSWIVTFAQWTVEAYMLTKSPGTLRWPKGGVYITPSSGDYFLQNLVASVLRCLDQSHAASTLGVRWTQGRWWLAPPAGCWGRGRQSTAQTWWRPKSDSSSSGRRRWRQWRRGALGRATRWHRRGRWRWQSLAGLGRSGCTRAMAPADCVQRGETSFCGFDLMLQFRISRYLTKT